MGLWHAQPGRPGHWMRAQPGRDAAWSVAAGTRRQSLLMGGRRGRPRPPAAAPAPTPAPTQPQPQALGVPQAPAVPAAARQPGSASEQQPEHARKQAKADADGQGVGDQIEQRTATATAAPGRRLQQNAPRRPRQRLAHRSGCACRGVGGWGAQRRRRACGWAHSAASGQPVAGARWRGGATSEVSNAGPPTAGCTRCRQPPHSKPSPYPTQYST